MQGKYPHIEWLPLQDNGISTECAVMKRDQFGNIYFIALNTMDKIDKTRLRNIITSRHANKFPLWELMRNVTLQNGKNALEYFHQLVKILTPQGVVMNVQEGRMAGMSAPQARKTSPAPKAQVPNNTPTGDDIPRPSTAAKTKTTTKQ